MESQEEAGKGNMQTIVPRSTLHLAYLSALLTILEAAYWSPRMGLLNETNTSNSAAFWPADLDPEFTDLEDSTSKAYFWHIPIYHWITPDLKHPTHTTIYETTRTISTNKISVKLKQLATNE